MTILTAYNIHYTNEFKKELHFLKSRWKNEKHLQKFKQDLVHAIQDNDSKRINDLFSKKTILMTVTSNITYEKIFDLVDLRGIELKNLTINDLYFSYVCFDYCQLNNVQFIGTHLQYSSFNHSKFKDVDLNQVQASPISALNLHTDGGTITDGFFMWSDFTGSVIHSEKKSNKNQDMFDRVLI